MQTTLSGFAYNLIELSNHTNAIVNVNKKKIASAQTGIQSDNINPLKNPLHCMQTFYFPNEVKIQASITYRVFSTSNMHQCCCTFRLLFACELMSISQLPSPMPSLFQY